MQRLWMAAAAITAIVFGLPQGSNAQQAVAPTPQLDQLLAPVALYPDPLLAEILTASTYPIEIVQADRWLQSPSTAYFRNDPAAFQAALAQQSWDSNVKALTFFPQVLQTMDANIQWTQSLGNAFLTEQPSVMASIQHLRSLAAASGNLVSTPQQSVVNQNGLIVIQPTSPQTIYVPYYNASAYGNWPWPDMPPVTFAAPSGAYLSSPALVFGSGIMIAPTWFYFVETNWRYNRVDNHGGRPTQTFITPFGTSERSTAAPPAASPWTSDPAHRYIAVDEATRARLNPAAAPHPQATAGQGSKGVSGQTVNSSR